MLAWPVACAWIALRRPRGSVLWLATLMATALALIASQPRGPRIYSATPQWDPGRFWRRAEVQDAAARTNPSKLPTEGNKAVRFAIRRFCDLGYRCAPGLLVLALGAAGAVASRGWPTAWPVPGRAMVAWVFVSWGIFFLYVSLFWQFSSQETGKQFLPWLSLVSLVAGFVGCREAWRRWLRRSTDAPEKRAFILRRVPSTALAVLWVMVLLRAYGQTEHWTRTLGKPVKSPVRFSADTWSTLRFLQTSTTPDSRVLSPFGSGGPSPKGDHAISAWAGRRAVDEHRLKISAFFPDLRDRCAARQGLINGFFEDPQGSTLERLAARWHISYVVLPSEKAEKIPQSLGDVRFRTEEWSVIQIRSVDPGSGD